MLHRTVKRRPSVLLTCFAGLLIIIIGVPLLMQATATSGSAPAVSRIAAGSTQKMPAQLPARLSIPSIGVDAVINRAGLAADGTMAISKNIDQVAWYEFGARPGDEGSAVIAGHFGWEGSHGAVFNNLHQLTKGDTITVIDVTGATTNFIVRATQLYKPTANATAIFQSSDGKAHLNLITCDGTWVNAKASYSERLVVFADLK